MNREDTVNRFHQTLGASDLHLDAAKLKISELEVKLLSKQRDLDTEKAINFQLRKDAEEYKHRITILRKSLSLMRKLRERGAKKRKTLEHQVSALTTANKITQLLLKRARQEAGREMSR